VEEVEGEDVFVLFGAGGVGLVGVWCAALPSPFVEAAAASAREEGVEREGKREVSSLDRKE
jgi:hypothetical protein